MTQKLGSSRVVTCDERTTTGQIQIAAADIAVNGALVGFEFGCASGVLDSAVIRADSGSGKVLHRIYGDATGAVHAPVLVQPWARFTSGLHVTFAGTGAFKLTAYVALDP